MKITIVTPYDSANYGAYLQALANKIFLEELGHSVFFYKWRSPKKRKQLFFGKKDSIKNLIKYVMKYKYNAHKYHVFSDALDIFHEIDENELSAMELAILGSDEIWNINVNTFQNPVFYGEINVPKICAYAPSAGNGAELERYNSVCCSLAQVEIIGVKDRETILLREISKIQDQYDFIFIDCPPSLGVLTINALTAVDSVLIPIQCEFYALEGVGQLINTVQLVKKSLNKSLDIEGVVMTMYDYRTNLSNEVYEEAKKFFNDKVYETTIARNIRLAEAPSFGLPIMLYDEKCKGAAAYKKFAKEFLSKQ